MDPVGLSSRRVRSGHHRACRYSKAFTEIRVTDDTMRDHDDKLPETVASRIGKRIDWR